MKLKNKISIMSLIRYKNTREIKTTMTRMMDEYETERDEDIY